MLHAPCSMLKCSFLFVHKREGSLLREKAKLQRKAQKEKKGERAMADTLAALRSLMASHSPPLHALVVPSEDYHHSDYVSARDKRRQFVSGFTGSAGLALITLEEARLWTDGRYFLQAEQQLSDQWKLMRMGEDPPVDIWMADNLQKDACIGVDPWCITVDTAQRWEHAFSKKRQKLVKTSTNLVDEVWKSRPPSEANPVVVHPLEFSGRSVVDKLKDLREKLVQEKARGIIIRALDEVAWLYNVRGADVSYFPVVHAFALVTLTSAFFYVDKRKLSSKVTSHMKENGIQIRDYGAVISDVILLASDQLTSTNVTKSNILNDMDKNSSEVGIGRNGRSEVGEKSNDFIWVDPSTCCFALYSELNANKVLLQQSPLALAKALKNPVELDGLRKAQIRDGVAVVQYLVWLDKQMQDRYAASGYFLEAESGKKKENSNTIKLTEASVSDKLEEFRALKENFRGLSFQTISSVGPNAAIFHYLPDAKACAELDPNSFYLFDSGAQYLDGTTDITRTIHFGKPTEHEKECYTTVLKGHINLDNATFPSGTTGKTLDVFARIPFWKSGLDYKSMTGHGIGSFLNVDEGPHQISFIPEACNMPLQASMTVTNEPGYYEDGKFGIRLENVLIVKDANTKFNFGDKGYLSFEHITWAPFQIKPIDLSLLVPEEIEWLNNYHSKCREILAPYLDEFEMAWLKKATEPISV